MKKATSYLLMGNFLVNSQIADRMYVAFGRLLSGVRGGLAIVSIIVCVALAMCGGFGPGIMTMGLIAVPSMLKQNYDRSTTVGCVMAGGVLGEIIPPAIIMIIFCFVARLSIGKIFAGCVVPGFILATLYLIYVVVKGYVDPDSMPRLADSEKVTWAMRWHAVKESFLPTMLVLSVLGSILLGIATPTEASGIGAVGSIVICALYGKLNRKVIMNSCLATLSICGIAMWIIIVTALFGVFYTSMGAQDMILEFVDSLHASRWIILIAMQLLVFLFGMFMDDAAIVILCAPIFMPIAKLLGFDIYWFAVLFILNVQCAYLTPPFGWALIIMKSVVPPEVQTKDLWLSTPPYLLMILLVMILVMIFPEIAMWLPNKLL